PIACWALTFKYCCWCWADRAKVPEEWYVRPRPRPVTIIFQGIVFLGIWWGACWLASKWLTLLHYPVGYYGAFFSFRALHLEAIVSTLAAMHPLLASIYIGAIFYVWHLLFNDKIRPRLNPSWEKPPEENKFLAKLRDFFFDDFDEKKQSERKAGGEQSR